MAPSYRFAPCARKGIAGWHRSAVWRWQFLCAWGVAISLTCGLALALSAQDPGTTFSYQGKLSSGGAPVTASCVMKFKLYDALAGGAQIGGDQDFGAVQVSAGNFAVNLDFGSGAFTGAPRYLAIGVQCPGDGSLTTLTPRQALYPTPYAIYSGSSWNLAGNTGITTTSFLGTTDSVTVTVKVSGTVAMRYAPGISGGTPNVIGGFADNEIAATVAGGVIAGGGASSAANQVTADYATVGGGSSNSASGASTTVGGGSSNTAGADYATVGGGSYNFAAGEKATVGGGDSNNAASNWSTVGGGYLNGANGTYAAVSGGFSNSANTYAAVGGGFFNQADGAYTTVGGGQNNWAFGANATVGGGYANRAFGAMATVGGGISNLAEGDYATVGGGFLNTATALYATATGGISNTASASYATAGGGFSNTVSASYAVVGGGYTNVASGQYATVAGGDSNSAGGNYSFAAGRRAKANTQGAFVWADSSNANLTSSANNQFLVRASGGITLYTNSAATIGAALPAGSGSWGIVSDRNLKAHITPVDSAVVLAAVAAMPVSTWNYVSQDEAIRHMGPMAQDFRAAFDLGENDTTIATVDADGVALAAIQGLYAQNQAQQALIEAQQAQLAAQQAQIEALLARVAALETK